MPFQHIWGHAGEASPGLSKIKSAEKSGWGEEDGNCTISWRAVLTALELDNASSTLHNNPMRQVVYYPPLYR